jgi:hypothetical protein
MSKFAKFAAAALCAAAVTVSVSFIFYCLYHIMAGHQGEMVLVSQTVTKK